MPHKFNPENADKLDSDERKTFEPPHRFIELLNLKGNETVVDLGAGTGYFAIPLAEKYPNVKIYCLDVQEEMLDILRRKVKSKNLRNVEILKSDEDTLPLEDSFSDVIIMAHVFHELEFPDRILNECHRVLKNYGSLYIIDWKPIPTDFGPPLEERIDAEEVIKHLTKKGFKNIETFDIYEYQYTIKGVKS